MALRLPRFAGNVLRRHHCAAVPHENFYKLLGVTESFQVDSNLLSENFKSLQRQWHPDKFVSKPQPDQQGAANMSAKLNEAYSVLRVPYKRAKHLLQIRAEHSHANLLSIDDLPLEPQFLMWVLEIREATASAAGNLDKLRALRGSLETALKQCLDHLAAAFEGNNLDIAAKETAKLQYLRRIEQAIDDLSYCNESSTVSIDARRTEKKTPLN